MAVKCKLIAYRRVSTQGQGASGLGLEAQDSAIAAHVKATGCTLIATYTEVESGKRTDRPELARAIAHAKRAGAALVFAKLDRLARNARFLLGMVEAGVDLVFCDFPSIPAGAAGKFMLTQMAAVAELEAGLISERTRAALNAAKARGVKLGGRRDGAHSLTTEDKARGGKHAAEASRARAMDAYADLVPSMIAWKAEELTLAEIADKLNAEGHTTRTGAAWSKVQVKRALDRQGQ